MKNPAKKRRKRAKRQVRQITAVAETPPKRRPFLVRVLGDIRRSAFMRGASTLTLFPQHPEVDCSVRAQREDLAEIWREVGGYMWTAFGEETRRIRAHERKK